MISWKDFSRLEPALSSSGESHLFQFGPGLAFLATIRKDGGPRIHPVCPILYDGHLYVFIGPDTPKKFDLLRDGRFALQAFPQPKPDSDEFFLAGCAEPVVDPSLRAAVANAAKSMVQPDEVLFELMVERAMRTWWENFGTPEMHSLHRKWHAPSGETLEVE